MVDFVEKLRIIILGIIFCFCTQNIFADEFTATMLKNYGDVTVIDVVGDYDVPSRDCDSCEEPRKKVAIEFFKNHSDDYDFLVIFSGFKFEMPKITIAESTSEAAGFYSPIRNSIDGIGIEKFDHRTSYGSSGKLQGMVNMGPLENKITDPFNSEFKRTMRTLVHEILHRWSAHVKFKDKEGLLSDALIGAGGSHWSYLLDTNGSVQYGNNWQVNGDGTFTALAGRKYYSDLDLYLMGLIGKEDVKPMLLIENPGINKEKVTEPGAVINGTPVEVTIDDIIAAEGERSPSFRDSQKSFKIGCILLTRPGQFSESDLLSVRMIMQNSEMWFSSLTDGRARLVVDVNPIAEIPKNNGITPPVVVPRNDPPSIEHGVSWLIDNQASDGKWSDSLLTEQRDTAQVLLLLKNFAEAASSRTTGLDWLNAVVSENTDYLSRKIMVLTEYSHGSNALIDKLLSRQNSDGGWGTEGKYISTADDTAIALTALGLAGFSDNNAILPAIQFLKAKQFSDGGWGNSKTSDIRITINVLHSFYFFMSGENVSDAVLKAFSWLEYQSYIDGGYGAGSSNIYDTANVILIQKMYGQANQANQAAVNYLNNLQAKNGSWNNSAFETAIAVNAIWKATIEPELSLSIEPITITTLPVNQVLSVHLHNNGLTDVDNVKVVIYRNEISNNGKIDEKILSVSAQNTTDFIFEVEIKNTDERAYYIVVDPDNNVPESNEINNTIVRVITPGQITKYDFVSQQIELSSAVVNYLDQVIVKTRIMNRGTVNAAQVPIQYSVNNGSETFLITKKSVSISAGTYLDDEYTWRCDKAGQNLKLIVTVDPDDLFEETEEGNNAIEAELSVDTPTKTNLSIVYDDISVSPMSPLENNNAEINCRIKNNGFAKAESFTVSCYVDNPANNGVLIDSQSVDSLSSGEAVDVILNWSNIDVCGGKLIFIKIEPAGNDEITLEDNTAFKSINVLSIPELIIAEKSITFNPQIANEGTPVTINVLIQNAGDQNALSVPVVATENGTVISPVDLNAEFIEGQSQQTVSFIYDTTGKSGAHEIIVRIDPDNTIVENNKNNNSASRTFSVQDYDHWLTEAYISPDGDGVKDETKAFFRFTEKNDFIARIEDDEGEVVRLFESDDMNNADAISIVWDGRNDKGVVVSDGLYQISVYDDNMDARFKLPVTVDNNRSLFTQAVGTEFLLKSSLTHFFEKITKYNWQDPQWQLLPDESGIIIYKEVMGENEYCPGVYRISMDGLECTRLTPEKWADGQDSDWTYKIQNVYFSIGSKIAVSVKKTRKSDYEEFYDTWGIDSSTLEFVLLHSSETEKTRLDDIYWSQDTSVLVGNEYNSLNVVAISWEGEKLYEFEPVLSSEELLNYDISYKKIVFSKDNSTLFLITQLKAKVGYRKKEKILSYSSSDGYQELADLGTNSDHHTVDVYVADNNALLFTTREGKYFLADTGDNAGVTLLWQNDTRGDFIEAIISTSGNTKIAFLYQEADNWGIKVHEDNETKTVYEAPYVLSDGDKIYDFSPFGGLCWSEDGKKIHFIDRSYKINGDCSSDSHHVTIDIDSLEKEAVWISGPNNTCIEKPMSYHIYCLENNAWIERGVLHYTEQFETQELNLSGWLNDSTPTRRMRISQKGAEGAFIDYIALKTGNQTFSPVEATDSLGGDALGKIIELDENPVDAYRKTIDVDWEGIPPAADDLTFVMNANEYLHFEPGPLRVNWIEENTSLIGFDRVDGMWAFSIETGTKVHLPVDADKFGRVEISSNDNYIVFENTDGVYESLTSLLNLTADLKVSRQKSVIALHGIAADLNFDSYMLEYSDVNDSEAWQMIMPPGSQPVVNDFFTTWVPPSDGSFYVRLTVFDKAGNSISDRKKIKWGLSSSICSLFLSRQIFSPANINEIDTVTLNYRVLEPVHLEFNIYNDKNELLRTINEDHEKTGEYDITWDGKDSNGEFVPDGKYRIQVFDYYYFIRVDNTFPELSINTSYQCMSKGVNPIGGEPILKLSFSITEKNAALWNVQYLEHSSPSQWRSLPKYLGKNYRKLPEIEDSIETKYQWYFSSDKLIELQEKQYRIKVSDSAGNTTIKELGQIVDPVVIITEWNGKRLFEHSFKEDVCGNDLFTKDKRVAEGTVNNDGNNIGFREFIGPSIETITVQYRDLITWKEMVDEKVTVSESVCFWDNSELDMRFINAVRIKVTDSYGVDYFSNTVVLKVLFELDNSYFDPYTSEPVIMVFQEHPGSKLNIEAAEPINNLKYMFRETLPSPDNHLTGYSEWKVFKEYDESLGDIIPFGPFFRMPDAPENVQIMMVATGVRGTIFRSNITALVPKKIRRVFNLRTGHHDIECDQVQSNFQLNIEMFNKFDSIRKVNASNSEPAIIFLDKGKVRIQSVDYYIAKHSDTYYENNPDDLIAFEKIKALDFDNNTLYKMVFNEICKVPPLGGSLTAFHEIKVNGDRFYNIDTDAELLGNYELSDKRHTEFGKIEHPVNNLEEGTFKVKAIVKFKDDVTHPLLVEQVEEIVYGEVEINYRHQGVESLSIIDDQPRICIKKEEDSIDYVSLNNVSSLYWGARSYVEVGQDVDELFYARANAVELDWQKGVLCTGGRQWGHSEYKHWILEFKPEQNAWCNFENEFAVDYYGNDYQVKLINIDPSGNRVCRIQPISFFDKPGDVTVSSNIRKFSPDGDGINDVAVFEYNIYDAPARININIQRQSEKGGIDFYDTLLDEEYKEPGTYTQIWDGLAPIPDDGTYFVNISGNYSCGEKIQANSETLLVDRSPPVVDITYPIEGSSIGAMVEVKGSVTDYHFKDYKAELYNSDKTITIKEHDQPVEGVICRIPSVSYQGLWTLKVTANDTFGHSTSREVQIDFDNQLFLIQSFDATYKLFSPEITGPFSETAIQYDLIEQCNITSKVTSGADIVKEFQFTNVEPGQNEFIWDGKNNSGNRVDDGFYTLSLTAELSSDTAVTQNEAITLTVDTLPPVVDIVPANLTYYKDTVLVKGTISDPNIKSYSVSYLDGDSLIEIDSGKQNRDNHFFTTLTDLPEGEYNLIVKAEDKLNQITEVTGIFVVDRTPPKHEITGPENGRYFGGDNSIEVKGLITEKNPDSWELRYGPGSYPDLWTVLFSGDGLPASETIYSWNVGPDKNISDGMYTLSLLTIDKAGWETETKRQVYVDNTPPEVEVVFPAGKAFLTKPGNISGKVYDLNIDNYSIELTDGSCLDACKWSKIAGSEKSVTNGPLVNFSTLPEDGIYSLKITVKDKAGNLTETVLEFIVDTIPPSIPDDLKAEIINKDSVNLSWGSVSDNDLVGYNVYREETKINTDPVTATTFSDDNLEEATYSYKVTAVDHAGLESNFSDKITVQIDYTPPAVGITTPSNGGVINDLLNIKGTASSKDDFKEYRLYYGMGDSPATWLLLKRAIVPVAYGLLAQNQAPLNDGGYSLKLEAEDINGNVNFVQVNFEIETVPPGAPVLDEPVVDGNNVTLTWGAVSDEDLDGYILYRDGKPANQHGGVTENLSSYILRTTEYTDKEIPDGLHNYYLEAIDIAGNKSDASNSRPVTIDTRAPMLEIVTPEDAAIFETAIKVEVTSEDTDIKRVAFQYKSSADIEWVTWYSAETDLLYTNFYPEKLSLGYGNYDLRVTAYDQSEQMGVSNSVSVTCKDLTPPSSPQNSEVQVNGGDVSIKWQQSPDVEPDLAGYFIYMTSNSSREKLNAAPVTLIEYPVSNLGDGEYFFDITSVDISGNESQEIIQTAAIVYTPVLNSEYGVVTEETVQLTGKTKISESLIDIFVDNGNGPINQGTVTAGQNSLFTHSLSLVEGDNTITVRATDSSGNISKISASVLITYAFPPQPPLALTATATATEADIQLEWSLNSETNISGYNIYRSDTADWKQINTNQEEGSTYDDKALKNGGYRYKITALNTYGLESDFSNIADAEINIALPVEPADLYVAELPEDGGKIKLCWNHPDGAANYVIYRSTVTGTDYGSVGETVPGETCFTDDGLPNGITYFYVVTAKDSNGNESLYSNEVSAVPVDRKQPAPPVFFEPCISGQSCNAASDKTDITGFAEPAVKIDLFKNDNPAGSTVALPKTVWNQYNFEGECDTYEVTGDGRFFACIGYDEVLTLYDTIQGIETKITQSCGSIKFSPDGLNLFFQDDTQTVLYNMESASSEYISENSPEIKRNIPAWANDSQDVVFLRQVNGEYELWKYNVISGQLNQLTDAPTGAAAAMAQFSPVDDKIAYMEYSFISKEAVLSVMDQKTGNVIQVQNEIFIPDGQDIYLTIFKWSPDGDSIVCMVGSENAPELYLYQTETMSGNKISGSDPIVYFEWSPIGNKVALVTYIEAEERYPLQVFDTKLATAQDISMNSVALSWSPCGTRLIYTEYNSLYGYTDIFIKSVNSDEAPLQLTCDEERFVFLLKWLKDGRLFFVDFDFNLYIQSAGSLIPAGYYSFDDIELDIGSNLFHGTATDTGSNTSEQSESIDVVLAAANLPDLSVDTGNINLMPASPVQGEGINVFITIENNGKGIAENIPVDVYLWTPSGDVEIIHEAILPVLSAKSQSFITFKIENSLAGIQEIIVDIDPYDLIMEGDESNNYGSKEFFVSTLEGLTLNLGIDSSSYGGNDDIHIETDIYNAGFDTECLLELRVKDGNGYQIETILSQNLILSYGAMEKIKTVWNSGSIFAGQYSVEAVIIDTDGNIKEASVLFNVNLATGATSAISTDKSVYDSNQDAEIKVEIINNGELFCIPELDIRLTVRADNDSELFSKSYSVVNLLSGTPSSEKIIWNTGLNIPGIYKASVQVRAGGVLLQENSASFEIRPSLLIKGTIKSNVALATPGDLIQFDYSATSYGNEAPGTLPVSIIVLDSENNEIVTTVQDNLTLGMNETVLSSAVLSTQNFALKTYNVVLRSYDGSDYDNLASTVFVLADLSAPVIKVNSPNSGKTYIGDIELDLNVTDSVSGLRAVEFRLDGDTWLPMANIEQETGRWHTGWDASDDEGAHTVEFRAIDLEGNEAKTDLIAFNVERPFIDITGSLSLTPQGTATIETVKVDYTYTNSGNIAANDILVKLSAFKEGSVEPVVTEDNIVTIAVGITNTAESIISVQGFEPGAYIVRLTYLKPETDEWSEIASAGFQIKDLIPPELIVLSPLSGTVYNGTCEFAVTATDALVGVDRVEYRIDNQDWIALPSVDILTGSYGKQWEPQPADEGLRLVSFRAFDKAGNVSATTGVSFTVELMNAFEKITGSLTVSPATVYQWQTAGFNYTISNDIAKDVGTVTVKVAITDSDSGNILKTFEREDSLSASSTVSGSFGLETVEFPVSGYTVTLSAVNTEMVSRQLSSAAFTVQKSVGVEPVEPKVTNLLVWVNDNCQSPRGEVSGTDGAHCIFEDCVRVDLIEQIMESATDNYHIVYEADDFRNELRNPFYTDIFIFGTTTLPDLTTVAEIIEKTNTGTGIASSLWLQQGITIGKCFELSSIFGIVWNGVVLSLNHDVITTDGTVTDVGGFDARGLAYVVAPDDDAVVEARFKEDKRHFSDYPAIVLNKHGSGKTAYFAFDLGLALDDDSYETIKEIITRTVEYIHTEKTSAENYSNRIVPVEVRLESYNGDYAGRSVTSFSPPLKVYDPTTGELTSENPQTLDKAIKSGETGSFISYIVAPESEGSWPVSSDTGIVMNDTFIPVETFTSDINVDISRDLFAAEILAEIKDLDVSFWYLIQKAIAVTAFKHVVKRDVTAKSDLDANINNIISTIHTLQILKRNDVSGLRVKLDKLLQIEESRYYFFNN